MADNGMSLDRRDDHSARRHGMYALGSPFRHFLKFCVGHLWRERVRPPARLIRGQELSFLIIVGSLLIYAKVSHLPASWNLPLSAQTLMPAMQFIRNLCFSLVPSSYSCLPYF